VKQLILVDAASLCAPQIWTGGHDNKINAISMKGSLLYQVGDLTDSGSVNQPSGTKAIVRCDWNVWVFGVRTINVYSAHCTAEQVAQKVCIVC
jgi:hypothetical protein